MTDQTRIRARAALAAAGFALLAAAAVPVRAAEDPCADPDRVPSRSHVHVIDDGAPLFEPASTTICLGDTVEWDNHADRIHTVTHVTCKRADARYDDCEFDSIFSLGPGATFEHVFATRTGVFDYKCTIHGFTARVTVLDEAGAVPDLTVAALEVHDTASPVSKRLQASISNLGEAAASPTTISFAYQNVDGSWVQIGEPLVGALNAGTTIQINQTWLVANKIGDFPVRVVVDAGGNVLEADEANNELLATVPVWLPPGILPGVSGPEPA